jgi:hypothetical protein
MTTEPTDTTQVAAATIEQVETNIRELLSTNRTRPTMPLKLVDDKLGGEPPAPVPLPVDEVGHMAADAVLRVYEATALQVEQMGGEVKERIASLAKALNEADEDLKALDDAAQAIRAKGAAVASMVERAAGVSKAIRDMAADFKTRLATA